MCVDPKNWSAVYLGQIHFNYTFSLFKSPLLTLLIGEILFENNGRHTIGDISSTLVYF